MNSDKFFSDLNMLRTNSFAFAALYAVSGKFFTLTADKPIFTALSRRHVFVVRVQIQRIDILRTNKFGGFRYQQPMLQMKAKSNKVSFAGRCPALCLLTFFKLNKTTLECRFYPIVAPPSRRCSRPAEAWRLLGHTSPNKVAVWTVFLTPFIRYLKNFSSPLR